MKPEKPFRLTRRENDLVLMVMQGQANKIIAHKLGLRYSTIQRYMARLREKLGVGSKLGIALWVMKNRDLVRWPE